MTEQGKVYYLLVRGYEEFHDEDEWLGIYSSWENAIAAFLLEEIRTAVDFLSARFENAIRQRNDCVLVEINNVFQLLGELFVFCFHLFFHRLLLIVSASSANSKANR